MSGSEFLGGLALLILSVGSACALAAVVVRRQRNQLEGAARVLAFALVATAAFFLIHLIPAVLTILGKPAVAVAAVLVLALAAVVQARAPAEGGPSAASAAGRYTTPDSGRLSWGIAAAAAVAFWAYVVAHLAEHGREEPTGPDMTTFHLPNIVQWIQTGSIWQDTEFVPLRSFGTYPNTGDVIALGYYLPFDNDFLIRFGVIPFLGLLVLAIYALARELGAPAAPALLFATGFAAMPVVGVPAFEGLPDTVMLASFSSGLVFLVRHRRTSARTDLVLAGLGLGLAAGTKWYAPAAVVVVLAVWFGAALVERTRPREVFATLVPLVAIVAAAGGFWLVRNTVEVGNPVFPAEVSVAGITVFDAPRDIRRERNGYSLAHYLDDREVLREKVWPPMLSFMSWFAVALWVALALAGALAFARRRSKDGIDGGARTALICAVAAAGIGVMYVFLPYSAEGPEGNPVNVWPNSRYVVPALVIAAALGAWAMGRVGRFRLVFEVLALGALVHALVKTPDFAEDVSAAAYAFGVIAVAMLVLGAWLLWRHAEALRARPAVVAGAVAAVLLVTGGALYAHEERFNDHRYTTGEPSAVWVTKHAPSDARVGVAGEGLFVLPMFGPRYENEVEYIGPVVDGQLQAYDRPEEFEEAVTSGDYDLVLLLEADHLLPGLPAKQAESLKRLGYTAVARGTEPTAVSQHKTLYFRP